MSLSTLDHVGVLRSEFKQRNGLKENTVITLMWGGGGDHFKDLSTGFLFDLSLTNVLQWTYTIAYYVLSYKLKDVLINL